MRSRLRSANLLSMELVVGSLILLLALGIFFDLVMDKQTYDEHPFLTSIPKDLFTLVAIGTVGVLFLDELRASWRAVPELRGLAPETLKSAGDVTDAITLALGVDDHFSIARSYNRAPLVSSVRRVHNHLYGVGSDCMDVARDAEGEDVSTQKGRIAWLSTLGGGKVSKKSDIEALKVLKHRTEELAEKLSEIRPFVPIDRRSSIGDLRANLTDALSLVSTAQTGLRVLLSEPTMKKRDMQSLGLSLMQVGSIIGAIGSLVLHLESDTRIDPAILN